MEAHGKIDLSAVPCTKCRIARGVRRAGNTGFDVFGRSTKGGLRKCCQAEVCRRQGQQERTADRGVACAGHMVCGHSASGAGCVRKWHIGLGRARKGEGCVGKKWQCDKPVAHFLSQYATCKARTRAPTTQCSYQDKGGGYVHCRPHSW